MPIIAVIASCKIPIGLAGAVFFHPFYYASSLPSMEQMFLLA
jgi:hypothetical protein